MGIMIKTKKKGGSGILRSLGKRITSSKKNGAPAVGTRYKIKKVGNAIYRSAENGASKFYQKKERQARAGWRTMEKKALNKTRASKAALKSMSQKATKSINIILKKYYDEKEYSDESDDANYLKDYYHTLVDWVENTKKDLRTVRETTFLMDEFHNSYKAYKKSFEKYEMYKKQHKENLITAQDNAKVLAKKLAEIEDDYIKYGYEQSNQTEKNNLNSSNTTRSQGYNKARETRRKTRTGANNSAEAYERKNAFVSN